MKNNSGKIRKTAKLIFIVGCVYSVITLVSFFTTVSSYISQGYPLFEVLKYLFASQFLPTVVQPFVLISGIAYIAGCVSDLFENQEHAHSVLEELKESGISVQAENDEAVEETAEDTQAPAEEVPELVEEAAEEVPEAVEEVSEDSGEDEETVVFEEVPEEGMEAEGIEVEEDSVEEEPEEVKELAFKTDIFGITTIGIKEELEEEEDSDEDIIEYLDLNPAEIEINVLKNGITNISTKEPVVNVDVNKRGIYTITRIK